MTAVQDVEATVGEYQWLRQLGGARGQFGGGADFGLEGWARVDHASILAVGAVLVTLARTDGAIIPYCR